MIVQKNILLPTNIFPQQFQSFYLTPKAKNFLPFRFISIQVRLLFCFVVMIAQEEYEEDEHPHCT